MGGGGFFRQFYLIKIITYHAILPPSRRGSQWSQIMHAQLFNGHPLAHLQGTWALIISSCTVFTVYPTPLQVISHRSAGGRYRWTMLKIAEWNSIIYTCTRDLHSIQSIAHYRASCSVIPLLSKATFTPSIQPNLTVPVLRLLPPYGTHPFSPCSNRPNTLWFTLLNKSLSVPALQSLFFIPDSIHSWPPTKLFKHFLKKIRFSWDENAVGTITHSHKHFFLFILWYILYKNSIITLFNNTIQPQQSESQEREKREFHSV